KSTLLFQRSRKTFESGVVFNVILRNEGSGDGCQRKYRILHSVQNDVKFGSARDRCQELESNGTNRADAGRGSNRPRWRNRRNGGIYNTVSCAEGGGAEDRPPLYRAGRGCLVNRGVGEA